MTHPTDTPGYQGYRRNFRRDMISLPYTSSRKYEDFEVGGNEGLMSASTWASEYARRHETMRLLNNQRAMGGNTRLNPLHKEVQQARKVVEQSTAKTKDFLNKQRASGSRNQNVAEEKEAVGDASATGAPFLARSSSNPSLSSTRVILPRAGRPKSQQQRLGSVVYGSTYTDSIGRGLDASVQAVRDPSFPHREVHFPEHEGPNHTALEGTLTKSLAQAIARLPQAENLLKSDPFVHGSYARDYGAAGFHPLQRVEGAASGTPSFKEHNVSTSGVGIYPLGDPTHHHSFPGSNLTGPSGEAGARLAASYSNLHEGRTEYGFKKHLPYVQNQTQSKALTLRFDTARVQQPNQEETQSERQTHSPQQATAGGEQRPATAGAIGFHSTLTGFAPSSDVPRVASMTEMGSTLELFAGSHKGPSSKGWRIPGYTGHCPQSLPNQSALRGDLALKSPVRKDILLENYLHDMSGYTGSRPRDVVNLHGPRTPRGKKRMEESLVASLILDSMKV